MRRQGLASSSLQLWGGGCCEPRARGATLSGTVSRPFAVHSASCAIAWLAAVVTSAACAPPGPTGGLQPDGRAEIPGGQGGLSFDDVWYSPALGKVFLASVSRGLAVIDPDTLAVTVISGPVDSLSVTESGGRLFAID